MRSNDRPSTSEDYGAAWVRGAFHDCVNLTAIGSLTPESRAIIRFAIQWAPFGGATAGEIFVLFGVTHQQFLQMMREALDPREADLPQIRWVKESLCKSLTEAWQPSSRPKSRSHVPA